MITPVMPTYARADLAFEKGEGPYLYAQGGRRFLDFGTGIAVNTLGHSHPHLVKKLTEQVEKLWHTSNLYRIPGQEKLAEWNARIRHTSPAVQLCCRCCCVLTSDRVVPSHG